MNIYTKLNMVAKASRIYNQQFTQIFRLLWPRLRCCGCAGGAEEQELPVRQDRDRAARQEQGEVPATRQRRLCKLFGIGRELKNILI